jgi:hypothetical protein
MSQSGNSAATRAQLSEADKLAVSALLALFDACRAEILARSSSQAGLIALNITATGAVAGYYFSNHVNALILLIIPILSPMLGIMWTDHAINIGNIGRFIQDHIIPRLQEMTRSRLPNYELVIREFEQRRAQRLALLTAPQALLFAILPAGALALAWAVTPKPDALFYTLAGLGIASILIFGGYSLAIQYSWVWNGSR